jgi:alpha-beta hydrolase superfamily lysophospholipase
MTLPDLPPRFLPPAGWQDGVFQNNGHELVYGYALPEQTPKSAVVILAGRSEFREKYFETMHDLLARGYGVFIMDWYGQGRSERMSGNSRKDWNIPYETHLSDLNEFIQHHVRPRLAPHTPLHMLAHSMGGNIGLRYLIDSPDEFGMAAVSAPLLGLKLVRFLPLSLSIGIANSRNPKIIFSAAVMIITSRARHRGRVFFPPIPCATRCIWHGFAPTRNLAMATPRMGGSNIR